MGRSTALWAVLLLALGLRMYALGRNPLWYDEVAYAYLSRTLTSSVLLSKDLLVSPAFCLLLHVWQKLGGGDAWLRLHAVLCGLGVVWLAWLLGGRLAGRRGAWVSAVFAATAPFLVFYSRDAKMYALVAFLDLAATYLAMRFASPAGGARDLTLYGIVAIVLVYSHLAAPFYLAALNVVFVVFFAHSLWNGEFRKSKMLAWLAAQAAVAVASIPFLVAQHRYAQSMGDRHFWAAPPTWRTLYVAAGNLLAGYAAEWWVRAAALGACALLAVIALKVLRERRRDVAFLLCVSVVHLAVVYLYSREFRFSVFVDRYLIGSAAPILIVAACGLAAVPWKRVSWACAGTIAVLFGISLCDLYAYRFAPNPTDRPGVYRTYDAHGIRDLIRGQAKPGDVVWHPSWTTLAQVRWYTPELRHVLVDMAGYTRSRLDDLSPRSEQNVFCFHPAEIESACDNAARVWVVIPEDGPTTSVAQQGIAAWLNARAALVARKWFGGRYGPASVYLFDLTQRSETEQANHVQGSLWIPAFVGMTSEGQMEATELTLNLERGAAPKEFRLSMTNPGASPCELTYEATAADYVLPAAGLDRALREKSRWQVRPCVDFQTSRMAMYAKLGRTSDPNDVLKRQLDIPAGKYMLFIEILKSGPRCRVPAAELAIDIEGTILKVSPEEDPEGGGWQWFPAGMFEKTTGNAAAMTIRAEPSASRPEVFATFGQIAICRHSPDLGGLKPPPIVGSGPVTVPATSTLTVDLKLPVNATRLGVTVASRLVATDLWVGAGG